MKVQWFAPCHRHLSGEDLEQNLHGSDTLPQIHPLPAKTNLTPYSQMTTDLNSPDDEVFAEALPKERQH